MAAPTVGAVGTHLQDSGTATIAVPRPAGVVADSIVVCYIYLDVGNTISVMAPGFQHAVGSPQIVTGAGNHVHNEVWKRATGTDGAGTYDFTASAPTFHEADAVRYDGCSKTGDPFEGANGVDTTGTANTTSPSLSLTTTGPDRLIVWTATNWSGGSWTPPSGYTENFDAGVGLQTGASITQAVAGSTGGVVGTCTSSDKRTAWLGALMPDAGVASSSAPDMGLPPPLLMELIAAAANRYAATPASSIPSNPETGTGALGLSGTATVMKVASPTGRSSLGMAGFATAAKVQAQTARALAGLSGTGVAKKVASQASVNAAGLNGFGTPKKVSVQASVIAMGLSGSGTAAKKAPETGTAFAAFTPYAPTQGARPQTGRCSMGLSGRATVTHVSTGLTGRSVAGFVGTAAVKKVVSATGVAAVGISGRATVAKRATPSASASLGMTANGIAKHLASRTGAANLGLAGSSSPGARKPASGRTVLGMCGYSTVYKPVAIDHSAGPTTVIAMTGPTRLRASSPAISLEYTNGPTRLHEANTTQ